MSILDLVLLVPLAFGTWQGFRKGLLLELISLLALVIGILGALKLHSWGMEHLLPVLNISLQGIAPFVVFVLLFIGLVLGVHVAGKMLRTVMGLTPLGVFDSLGGAVIGFLKWFFALSLFIWASETAGINLAHEASEGSRLYPWLVDASPVAIRGISYVLPFAKELMLEVKNALE